jgi:hypothetical protein
MTQRASKRRKAHEVAKEKVERCQADIMKAEADLEVLQAEGLLSKKVRDKSATLQKKLTTLRETLVKLNEEYKEKAAKATAEDAALKRRKLIEEEKVENARVISDAATLILVEIVLGYQARFENTSDTSEKIFAHAHADYHKRIESGELGTSDAIATAESFTRRYKKELGCFNQLTAIMNKKITFSGTPADEARELNIQIEESEV